MFSGIGGFREGLTRAGSFTCVGHCEIDKYANRSYDALFDTKGEWFIEDARKADPETMPEFRLLCGGFPCQTFSIAGSRKGFGDPRGTLFFELARLAEARKPPYLLFENVPGLLSHDGGRTFATILNTLDRLGYGVEWRSLATKGGEYTDYIYKNQYSAVSESRKLDGSKAWDGYYLSYVKGYLCDEVNHYKTLSYADESTYHIHAEQESQDEVLKSGFSLQKLVSTTGQPSPALKLEGAGFTVYRISKLSKAAQFKQNPDGSYDAISILSAYRKDNYDNATLKYDFCAEGQAIANMFEGNTDTVNAYNATLTADGDFANGKGNGWVLTDQTVEYCLAEMFTNDEGIFRVEGLPYGQYLVVETTIPKDVFQCDPFIVTVDANSPQSRFTVPVGSATIASNNTYWRRSTMRR